MQESLRRLDTLVGEIVGTVDRQAIQRGGGWVGRSYKLDGRLLLRVGVKLAALRVQVGKEAYVTAPAVLRGTYKQQDWLIIRPKHADQGLAYIKALLMTRAGRSR